MTASYACLVSENARVLQQLFIVIWVSLVVLISFIIRRQFVRMRIILERKEYLWDNSSNGSDVRLWNKRKWIWYLFTSIFHELLCNLIHPLAKEMVLLRANSNFSTKSCIMEDIQDQYCAKRYLRDFYWMDHISKIFERSSSSI